MADMVQNSLRAGARHETQRNETKRKQPEGGLEAAKETESPQAEEAAAAEEAGLEGGDGEQQRSKVQMFSARM